MELEAAAKDWQIIGKSADEVRNQLELKAAAHGKKSFF
jgi:hypothetical protein